EGLLEWTGRDDYLFHVERFRFAEDKVTVGLRLERQHPGTKTNRQIEVVGVPLQVVGDVVLARVRVGLGGERHAREACVPGGREELQRLPPSAPGRADLVRGVEDREPEAESLEVVAHRQPGLAGSNYDHVQPLGHVGEPSRAGAARGDARDAFWLWDRRATPAGAGSSPGAVSPA